MKILITILVLIPLLVMAGASDLSLITKQTSFKSIDGHLFDFNELLFPPEADQKRKDWEQDFRKTGERYEKNPVSYIKYFLIDGIGLGEEDKSLLQYKSDYCWSFLYLYTHFFKDWENDDIGLTFEAAQNGYLFEHIGRSKENIERLWSVFKADVDEIVEPIVTKKSNENYYIKGLLRAWECIVSKPNYESDLEGIYTKLVDEEPDCDRIIFYVDPLVCEDVREDFTREGKYYKTRDVQWLYSFWVRRYHEGNAEIVKLILESLS